MKYKAADAPITFKEIVMVMINLGSTISEEKLISDKSFFWKMLEFLTRELYMGVCVQTTQEIFESLQKSLRSFHTYRSPTKIFLIILI